MTMKLIQKHLLKGTREFEIVDDSLDVRIKAPFNKETRTVSLAKLDPEPVVNAPYLEFHGRADGGPLLSLFLDKPNPQEFNAFVDTLTRRAREEYDAFVALKAAADPEGFGANVHHEPAEADDAGRIRLRGNAQAVDADRIDQAIRMLQTYVAADDIKPFLAALEALKAEPENEARLEQVVDAFSDLGFTQGAVLTYAPYISILLADDPLGDR